MAIGTFVITMIYKVYIIIQCITDIINLIIYKNERFKEKIIILCRFILNCLIFLYGLNSNNIYILLGTYIFLKLIFQMVSIIKIADPLLFTLTKPRKLLKKIDKNKLIFNDNNYYDLEISIHMAKKGSAMFGHGEFSFENKIYSYGCYNYHNRKLFGLIGDGILGVFDHDSYIKYCIEDKNRYILSYRFILNENEKKTLRNKINNVLKNCCEWYPDSHYKKSYISKMPDDIYNKANGKFFKFNNGPYKTFFLLRNNCVSLCNMFLESFKKTKLIKIDGTITPGTFYTYLEKMYQNKENNIVSKILYNKEKTKNYMYKKN